ncbi:lyase [Pseudidiomarina aestuarii]|uniref:Lyase n=1 Tax=Pseudidiomarina aestuarii TaxID=624146 RepID=A0A7Z6ZRW6_9GAMM|nr:lyase [Pseudidiomarina aestuarii]RUO38956.1 lyase [Pseudidiomarina aestuarii]
MLGMTFALLLAAEAPATVEITEWQVPWEQSRPRDPYVAGPDEVWFVGQQAHYAAILTPSTGDMKRIDLPDNAGPHNIIVDDRGAWYAGNKAAHIGFIDPDDYSITKHMLPGDGRRDVHTMEFTSDGDIWFTAQGANQVGHFDAQTETIKLWDVPTNRARPYGLIVHNDLPWLTLFGTNKLATITANGELKEIQLPRDNNRPRRIGITSDGNLWYVDYVGGFVGRYNPETEMIDEWRAPAEARSMPYAMAVDDHDYVWFAETGVQPNRLVGFNTKTLEFTQPFEVESGGGTIRHMVFDKASQSLWFGTDANTVGRAKINHGEAVSSNQAP